MCVLGTMWQARRLGKREGLAGIQSFVRVNLKVGL